MKKNIESLYEFISKMIILFERELDITSQSPDSNPKAKKYLTEMLNKLVSIILQLNKLSKESLDADNFLPEEDQKIIEHFLSKYQKNKS
jgi:hypothetical protein